MPRDPQFIHYRFDRLSQIEMQKRSLQYYQLMKSRRSVRKFSSEQIPKGVIENAVHTAGTAPSGAHKQPWLFCVVTDLDLKRQIRIAAEKEEKINYESRFPEEWLEDLRMLGTDFVKEYIEIAPALIVVFKENYRIVDGKNCKNYYVNESVGIAVGMLIAALHFAGLATLTHTPSPMGFLNEILHRPKNETPVVLMPVGYPEKGALVPDLKRKSLAEIMKMY